ncbi:hypothetical protein SESBI_20993 [Sesbania bispinosa]|nr:hypothetical protein SESBI_20993 [Sesbania bispinosa]
MEEVKSSLHSRELRCKASGNTEETSGSGLVVLNSTKNGKKNKDKSKKRPMSIRKTSAITVRNQGIGRKIVLRRRERNHPQQ